MKRAVIIIGNQGSGKSALPGVAEDVKNLKEFFLSNPGGAWESYEIFEGFDWTVRSLYSTILALKQNGTEYFVVVFTGHGYALENGDIYLELKEGEDLALNDLKSWLLLKKCLIITDSCRKVVQLLEKAFAHKELRYFNASVRVPRYKYRALYDSYIDSLDSFHDTLVTAAAHDEYAQDTDKGGLYCKALLDCAETLINSSQYGVYDVRKVHEYAAQKVRSSSVGTQNPQIESSSSTQTPPFVVIPSIYY